MFTTKLAPSTLEAFSRFTVPPLFNSTRLSVNVVTPDKSTAAPCAISVLRTACFNCTVGKVELPSMTNFTPISRSSFGAVTAPPFNTCNSDASMNELSTKVVNADRSITLPKPWLKTRIPFSRS